MAQSYSDSRLGTLTPGRLERCHTVNKHPSGEVPGKSNAIRVRHLPLFGESHSLSIGGKQNMVAGLLTVYDIPQLTFPSDINALSAQSIIDWE
jgi:hypothetical protein